VNTVGPALGHQRGIPAHGPAEIGRHQRGKGLELADRILGDILARVAFFGLLVRNAVPAEAVGVEIHAAAILHVRVKAARTGLCRARRQQRQRQILPVLNGKIVDLRLSDQAADVVGRGVHGGHRAGYFDHVVCASDLQRYALIHVLIEFDGQTLDGLGREAGRRDHDAVVAGRDGRERIAAIVAGLDHALVAAVDIHQRDRGVGDDRARGVGDDALHVGLAGLRVRAAGATQAQNQGQSNKDTTA
jgi:hypothetical protein